MPEKIIGILGGMGPEATIDLFYKIIKFTPAQKDQDHLRIIIDNNPKIPDRTAAILGKGEDPLPALQETAQNLEKAGADFIVIPCNTAHYFLSSIQESVNIPVLNMIEETAKETKKRIPQIKKVGLLASIGVYKSEIYHQHFKKFNIEVISPEEKDRGKVMKVIYTVKAGDLSEEVKKNILKITQKLIDKGAEAVIAGCTEIPLILKEEDILFPLIDPTKVLAKIAVQKAR
ncbi:aspartate racemase [Candidatus Atribacteria bacterium RBG_19FT_COMBO_35_14]|uniref:Aspartate racemase n=1 Tax=Candidatus Sediminicultor quintus TaxID=1797291 RepID=A0A1F5A597_9BACT|nr:MAG: aspartate racemase [Candidatus Atribacteria bacterium RBG_19FT_COMBO_35_14]